MNLSQENNSFLKTNTRKKLIKDTYRPQFCSKKFYIENQNEFKKMQHICHERQLNLQEKLQSWTIFLLLLRRPNDWWIIAAAGASRLHDWEPL